MNDSPHSTPDDATRGPSSLRDAADEELDTRGLRCPEPLLLLRNRMRTLALGRRLYVVATDPASVRDFDQYSRFLGHPIESRDEQDGEFRFLFRKTEGRSRG